jgi:hypothetical protein
MALSLEKVEGQAPDQSSLDAARKLLKAGLWPRLATDGAGLVWGECHGSGATPYRVVIAETDAGYKCSCPSRKFPCKHSLALMWMRAEGKFAFVTAEVPDWVKDWVSRRRGPGAKPAAEGDAAKSKVSIAAAAEATVAESDPKAEARATAARERNRKEREAAILAGLDELDVWLSDQVERGMAAFVGQSAQACKVIAQRLVDAKASGLAARLEAVPARLFSLPEAVRPVAAVEELGQVYLIAEAYRRQEALPAALRMDVRRAMGWLTAREELLADASALRVCGVWRVVAVLNEVQPDRLRRIETWMWREGAGDGQRFALLLDFVSVATGAATSGYSVGDGLEAEVVFYPSAAPLRALIVRVEGGAEASAARLELPEQELAGAVDAYEAVVGEQPWVGGWPLAFRRARVKRSGRALFVCDDAAALPIRSSQWELAEPLANVDTLDGVALWDGYQATLCWAETDLGRWVSA